MSDERYNGWANRETWAVALHINNDQGWQESVHEALREYVDEARADGEDVKIWHAGDVIRQNVETVLGADAPEGIYDPPWFVTNVLPIVHDIGSLYRVDWTELGASFLEDIAEGGE